MLFGPDANSKPLYLNVKDAYNEDCPIIVSVHYCLDSHATTPAQIISVFNSLAMSETMNHFIIGIVDDVTFTFLHEIEEIALGSAGMFL